MIRDCGYLRILGLEPLGALYQCDNVIMGGVDFATKYVT